MNPSKTLTWVVVAHRAGARIFAHSGPGKPLEAVSEIDHPEGRKHSGDIDADRPGRNRAPTGGSHHATDHRSDAHEHLAEVFATTLARSLADGRTKHAFAQLVLVAEPHFMGLLRAKLDAETARTVIGSVEKDLYQAGPEEIAPRLADVLPV